MGSPASNEIAPAKLILRCPVVKRHFRAVGGQVARQRRPLPGRAYDEDLFPLPAHVQTTASATPTIAMRRLINQNRCTIWVSLQPDNSK